MNLKQLLDGIKVKADYISLRSVHTHSAVVGVRNEVLEGVNTSFDHGLMVEIMVGGQLAYAATNSFDPSDVQKAAKRALQSAQHAHQFGLYRFSSAERPTVIGEYSSPVKCGISHFHPSDVAELLIKLSSSMKIHESILTRSAYYTLTEMDTHLVATNGTDIKQKIIRSQVGLSATATNDKGTQKRTYGDDKSAQIGIEDLDSERLTREAKRIATEALELLNADECPSETMDLLLAPDQMFLQIHESIGHPLELDRILGDERNYAGWSFVKPSDFGKLKYGSELMNVTFDPTVVGQNASYFADDIGAVATREFLIRNGILERGLGSLESQKRLGMAGVSSQRATSWNRAPIDRMANVNLEPGTSSMNDMISSVERGVLMRTTRSWSIDDYRNKFQFGCEYGQLIENGRLTKLVKNPNYRGITAPFWNQLKMVGDRSTFEVGGLGNCGKGEPNQIIFVGHASPACLFSNIEVFGGGK